MTETHNQRGRDCNRNAAGYRPEWWPNHDGYTSTMPYTILELCDQLHMDHSGSSDPLDPEWVELMVRCLTWVRDNWRRPSTAYDDAVLRLVIRTLNERTPKPQGAPDFICRRAP